MTYQGDTPLARTPYRGTRVPVFSSQEDVRRLLRKYGIEDIRFTFMKDSGCEVVFARSGEAGHMNVYRIRVIPLTPDDVGERQAWRMALHWLKTKVEIIEFGLTDFETEWLPYQLIAGDAGPRTVAEVIKPQLREGGTLLDPFRPALPAG